MLKTSQYLLVTLISLAACSLPGKPVAEPAHRATTLTFIHMNDTYRIGAVEDGRAGGFGRVVTIVRALQQQGKDVRILHAGDFLFPSLESQLWNGEQMVDALNFIDDIAPLYVVPGNHEFDRRTPDAIIDAVRRSRFDWLGDNWRLNTGIDDVDRRLRSGFVVASGGRRIGIVALTLSEADGGNKRGYAPVDGDYLGAAEAAIRRLEAQNVDAIIGLTHLYVWSDREIARLKARHPRFLLIAGGHEHEPEHEAATDASAEIVKGASNVRKVWQIDVSFRDDAAVPEISTRMIAIDDSIATDAGYEILEKRWRQKLLATIPFLTARVGTAGVLFDAREETIRNRESAWGDFIADQMRTAFGEPAADFAFVNSGTLRIDDYIAGEITFEDVGRTFGFSSYLRYLGMSGRDFKTLIEAGFRGFGPSKGYFPQISGFRVCVDRGRPDGDRVIQLQLPAGDGWQDIEAGREYLVVAPDFLYRGGDGYDFSNATDVSRPGSELKYLVLDAIIRAQAVGTTVGQAVDPLEPRIAMLAQGRQRCFR